MDLKLQTTKHLPVLEGKLSEFFSQMKKISSANSDMSRYHFQTGGKRLRGLIPFFIYDALGKSTSEILPLALATEIIHNATLVHDDLQDGDELRRGLPTVWKKYSSAQAINCGDALFQYAFLAVMELKLPQAIQLKVFRTLVEGTLKVIEGQAQEFIMKEESYPSVNRYLEVIEGKTSGLFDLPTTCTLIAAEQPTPIIECMREMSKKLGLLFQIQDDLLDIYGNKGRDQVATDIAEGKISILVAHVYENGSQEDKIVLKTIIQKPREETTKENIQEAITLFAKYKSKEKALEIIRGIQKEIKTTTQLPTALQSLLIQLSDLFLEPIREIL